MFLKAAKWSETELDLHNINAAAKWSETELDLHNINAAKLTNARHTPLQTNKTLKTRHSKRKK